MSTATTAATYDSEHQPQRIQQSKVKVDELKMRAMQAKEEAEAHAKLSQVGGVNVKLCVR